MSFLATRYIRIPYYPYYKCGREYGYAEHDLRATDLSTLSADDLDGLPTNNCINEQDLSKFDKEAILSKCRNRRFKAKSIRNMVLYKSLSVVAWQETNGYLWYLGYVKEVLQSGQILVDHLTHISSSDSKWKYLSNEDVHDVDPEQIVPIEVIGEWDMAFEQYVKWICEHVTSINCKIVLEIFSNDT